MPPADPIPVSFHLRRGCVVAGLILWMTAQAVTTALAADSIEIGRFSALADDSLPAEWEPLTFDNIEHHTQYQIVSDGGVRVLRAISRAAASGLVRRIEIEPTRYPFLEWSWKIDNLLRNSDVTRREGDDYPARLYITFQYDEENLGMLDKLRFQAYRLLHGEYPPTALSYIWDGKAPRDSRVPNAYTGRVMMIVAESGASRVGRWVHMRRNVYQDYRAAFGKEPPLITGVAVMTDTDNTGESATAYYGDIRFTRADTPSMSDLNHDVEQKGPRTGEMNQGDRK